MNTPAHAVLNLAFLGRRNKPNWNPLIIWGALIPDLAMFGFYAYMMAVGVPQTQIWGVEYYRPFWQLIFDFFNSIPLALVGLGIMLYAKRTGIALLFASIILHCLEDLPLHNDDAHRHFWPLSDYRFISPVSYWDTDHYGNVAGVLELIVMAVASVYVFRRVRSRWTKGLLIVANALPLVVYAWFAIVI